MARPARTRKGALPRGEKNIYSNNWAANKSSPVLKWQRGKRILHSHCVQRNSLVWCFALKKCLPHRFDHWAETDRELRASRVLEFVLFLGTSRVTQTYLAAFARLNAFMAFFATIHVSHTRTHTPPPPQNTASSPLCNTHTCIPSYIHWTKNKTKNEWWWFAMGS